MGLDNQDGRTIIDPTALGKTGLLGRAMAEGLAARAARLAAGEDLEATHGEPDPPCAVCRGAGFITPNRWRRKPGIVERPDPFPCPRCMPVPTRDEHLAAARLWPIKTFDEWNAGEAPEMDRAVLACHEIVDGSRWLIFMRGGVGRGKTHLAKATAVAWVEAGRGPLIFLVAAELLDELRDTQHDGATESLIVLLARYAETPLLIIDDLGAERPTAWAMEQVFKIVDRRTREKRPLIVTSNVRPSEERDRIEERVLSRLAPGEIVVEGGVDRRRSMEAP